MGRHDGFLTSSPSRMCRHVLHRLCRGGDLWRHIGTSCLETVVGFTAGTLLGNRRGHLPCGGGRSWPVCWTPIWWC
ncbi:MAG: hypothetical protein ACLU38_00105 [Dysosmobacter sp.]